MDRGTEVGPCLQQAVLGIGPGGFQMRVEGQMRQGGALGSVPGSFPRD